jgi:hypothetical protein
MRVTELISDQSKGTKRSIAVQKAYAEGVAGKAERGFKAA